jgi:hypothetical protein
MVDEWSSSSQFVYVTRSVDMFISYFTAPASSDQITAAWKRYIILVVQSVEEIHYSGGTVNGKKAT